MPLTDMFRGNLILALLAVFVALPSWAQPSGQWHTTPDKWKEPRVYHTPFDPRYEERIAVAHVVPSQEFKVKVMSPNKAYWLGLNPDREARQPTAESVEFRVLTPDARIYVFNERSRLIEITLKDHYPNFFVTARWISEKLLSVRVPWGRVLWTDFVFDVERESFVYREMSHDGKIPFQQSRQRP